MNVAEHERDTSHDDTRVGGDTRPELGSLLCDGAGDGGALHFTLGVDDHTRVVLEVQVDSVRPSPGLALSDNDGGHDLLPELGLTLLDGSDNHVTGGSGGESVQSRTDTVNGNDEQVLGARVVSAVHDGTDWQGQGHSEFGTNSGL